MLAGDLRDLVDLRKGGPPAFDAVATGAHLRLRGSGSGVAGGPLRGRVEPEDVAQEILAALLTLYTAGGTTTERMVSSGLLLLLQHPEQMALLRAQPSLLSSAVTEILRFHHPNQQTSTARLALEPIEIGGRTIDAGHTVRLGTGAANRDPARWPHPDRFDITRPEMVSLSFGQGIHYCIGAPLARLQTQIAIGRLLQRCSTITLADGDVRHDPRRMDRYERIIVEVVGR